MSKRFLTPVNLPSGVTFPLVGSIGDLFFKSDEGKVYVYTGSVWSIQQGPVGPTGATGPIGPQGEIGPTGPAGEGVTAIGSLTDVELTNLADGDVLLYNQISSKWVNVSLTEIIVGLGAVSGVSGGDYNTTMFSGTIDGGFYNTTEFASIVDGGNEGSF